MEGDEDTVLFIWPSTVVHRIDEDSPFYNMSAKDFYRKHYEIIVCLEGIVEPTGMSIQARSSYLGDEILWGYRFANVLNFADGCYQVDYSAFDKVEKVDTPSTSAKHQMDARNKSSGRSQSAPNENRESLQVRLLDQPVAQLQKAAYTTNVFRENNPYNNTRQPRPTSLILTGQHPLPRRIP